MSRDFETRNETYRWPVCKCITKVDGWKSGWKSFESSSKLSPRNKNSGGNTTRELGLNDCHGNDDTRLLTSISISFVRSGIVRVWIRKASTGVIGMLS